MEVKARLAELERRVFELETRRDFELETLGALAALQAQPEKHESTIEPKRGPGRPPKFPTTEQVN